MKISRALPFIVFIAIAIAMAFGLQRDPKIIPSMLVNNPLPEISLPALDQTKPQFESSKLIGTKFLIINIFGSWCPSCRYEHPFLMQLANDKRFMLLGIDWKDDRTNATKYLEDYGNPFAQIGFDETSHAIINLGVTGAPETFVVDLKGIVRARITGPLTPENWAAEVEPLLNSK